MNYFFTADEHYHHENIIKYCNRPFSNVEEMNEVIIKRNNELVNKNDRVYHLGDFTLKNIIEASKIIKRLNGEHIFINGSHDCWNKKLPYIIEKKIEGIYIVMCHYAMRTWPRSHYGSIQLYGHSHGKHTIFDNQMDVGVDTNNFYPYSIEEIKKLKLRKNNFK